MSAEAIRALVIAAIAAAIFGLGWTVEGWRKDAEIALIKASHAEATEKAATENAVALDNARHRGDQLALQLAGWENTLTAFAEEKNREIAKLLTGRRCLDAGVVRVLNRQSGAAQLSGSVPQATSLVLRPDATPAAPADDGAFATDADVTQWVGLCQRSYDTCRARLDAIGNFYPEDAE